MFDLFSGQQESAPSIRTEPAAVSFDMFWAAYPRKVSKRAAQKAWQKLKPAEMLQAFEALPAHKAAWVAASTSTEYIPHASTWLNGARWEDEIEMPKPKAQPKQAWWSTEALILAKGAEFGLKPRSGEDWHNFKGRIIDAMKVGA